MGYTLGDKAVREPPAELSVIGWTIRKNVGSRHSNPAFLATWSANQNFASQWAFDNYELDFT